MTTEQFAKLQILLNEVDVPARMNVLYLQLEKEIEMEENEKELNAREVDGESEPESR